MIPAALVLLALLDGALIGFRSGAGRLGLVGKDAHMRRAVLLGVLAAGAIAVGGLVLAFVITLLPGRERWASLEAGGAAVITVFGLFAGLMVASLLVWLVPITQLRTLVTVSLLGPGTLLRPGVIVLGMVYAFARVPTWEVALLGAYGASAMLLVEPWLTRRFFPIDPRLVPPK